MTEPYRRVVILPIQLSNQNTGRGGHWGASARRRKEYEQIISLKYGRLIPPNFRQAVTVVRVLGKGERLYDPDSLGRGCAKEVFDAMTACGFFVDDSAKWISSVTYTQDETDREHGPYTKILIERCDA